MLRNAKAKGCALANANVSRSKREEVHTLHNAKIATNTNLVNAKASNAQANKRKANNWQRLRDANSEKRKANKCKSHMGRIS